MVVKAQDLPGWMGEGANSSQRAGNIGYHLHQDLPHLNCRKPQLPKWPPHLPSTTPSLSLLPRQLFQEPYHLGTDCILGIIPFRLRISPLRQV